MSYTSLISTDDLNKHLDSPDWRIIDCRFDLMNIEQGSLDFHRSHLPHAIYAHLDDDLSSTVNIGKTGRHPLPNVKIFSQLLSSWGIDSSIQVIIYDSSGGMIASRLWWMLCWLGHEKVAVLDGGWPKWIAEGRPESQEVQIPEARRFVAKEQEHLLASAEEAAIAAQDSNRCLLDARSADRYCGENEIFDVKAGHIPGAISAPCMGNLNDRACFADKEILKQRYLTLLEGVAVKDTIVYCGSGITATHDLLAMRYANLGDGKLYAGSWSHWITDSTRPIALGCE